MSSSSGQDPSSNASASPGKNKLLYPILRLFTPLQEQQGDHMLEQACEIACELESDIPESDRNTIKERIAL
jgi:hypothetical protein